MTRWIGVGLVVVMVCGGRFALGQASTWELGGNGSWARVSSSMPSTRPYVPAPELDRVEQLIRQNKNGEAEKLCVAWLQANKGHSQRDRALYLNAMALYQDGDRIKSFYYCDELLDEFPDSSFYYQALDLQYRIADRFLDGYKRKFLGIRMFTAYDEAIEMLFRIQNRSPGSPLAEQALLRTADYYFANRDYDFASDTYAAYMRSYPRSPEVPRCRLREAIAHYAQFRGPAYDATPMIDARQQFRSLMVTDKELAEEENVPALLGQIDRDLARKLYLTGDFYRRTHEPRAAAYSFKYLLKAFPSTPEAKNAKVALAKLPASEVAATLDPPVMPEFAPGSSELHEPGLMHGGHREHNSSIDVVPMVPDVPVR